MRIFLDTADVSQIAKAYDTGLINGVTTNPSLILKSGRQPVEAIKEIAKEFPNLESISAEVVADSSTEMLAQAVEYCEIASNVTIKVPCTPEGLKACYDLTDEGVTTNVTLVFSVAQAILAARAGATYLSPFVGRWFDNSVDGVDLLGRIRKAYSYAKAENPPYILAASVRDTFLVEQAALAGSDIATIPPNVFWSMFANVMTDKGLAQFQKDWDAALKA